MKTKVFFFVFVLLMLSIVGELGYLFYLNSAQNTKKGTEKKVEKTSTDTQVFDISKRTGVANNQDLSDFIDFITGALQLAKSGSKTYKSGSMNMVFQGQINNINRVAKNGTQFIYLSFQSNEDPNDFQTIYLTEERTKIINDSQKELVYANLKTGDIIELNLEFNFQKKQSFNIIKKIIQKDDDKETKK